MTATEKIILMSTEVRWKPGSRLRAVKIPAGEKMEVYIYCGPDFLENEAVCIKWNVTCMAYDVGVTVAFTELYVALLLCAWCMCDCWEVSSVCVCVCVCVCAVLIVVCGISLARVVTTNAHTQTHTQTITYSRHPPERVDIMSEAQDPNASATARIGSLMLFLCLALCVLSVCA